MLVGDRLTEWFPIKSGVRQGDSLSPTLFAIFINNLASELNVANRGVKVGDTNVSIMMYVDDVVILSNNYKDAQFQLDILS